jgi:hypothetical protein
VSDRVLVLVTRIERPPGTILSDAFWNWLRNLHFSRLWFCLRSLHSQSIGHSFAL